MFEILSFIFGGVFRLLPEVFKLWDKQKDREHERLMFDLQLRADESRNQMEIDKILTQGEVSYNIHEIDAIAKTSQAVVFQKTGNKFLDSLLVLAEVASSFVRPVLTYWYCIVAYGASKISLMYCAYYEKYNTPASRAVGQLWTPQDHQIMVSIIGFWFVDRAIRKLNR